MSILIIQSDYTNDQFYNYPLIVTLLVSPTYFHQDFEAIGIDKRGFKLRLEKAAKKLPSLPIETSIPVSGLPLIGCGTWNCILGNFRIQGLEETFASLLHCKNIWVTSTIFSSSQLHACCVSETLAMNFINGFLQFESKCS